MPRDFNIHFRGGVSRRPGQADTNAQIPYSLHNVRIKDDLVVATSHKSLVDASYGGKKPWIKYGYKPDDPVLVITMRVGEGRIEVSEGHDFDLAAYIGSSVVIPNTEDGSVVYYERELISVDSLKRGVLDPPLPHYVGGVAVTVSFFKPRKVLTGDEGIIDGDSYAGRIYTTETSGVVHKYLSSGKSYGEPPRILGIGNSNGGSGDQFDPYSADDRIVSYLLIPVSKHSEAGEWMWWSRIMNTDGLSSFGTESDPITLYLDVNEQTDAVIVYKIAGIEYGSGKPMDIDVTGVDDTPVNEALNWYYVDRFDRSSAIGLANQDDVTADWFNGKMWDLSDLDPITSGETSDQIGTDTGQFNWTPEENTDDKLRIFINQNISISKLYGATITFSTSADGGDWDWLGKAFNILRSGQVGDRTYIDIDLSSQSFNDEIRYYPGYVYTKVYFYQEDTDEYQYEYHLLPETRGHIVDFSAERNYTSHNETGLESTSFATMTIAYPSEYNEGDVVVTDGYMIDHKQNDEDDLYPASSATTLTRLHNVYDYQIDNPRFTAESVYNDGGTMLYGNVAFSPHKPFAEVYSATPMVAGGKVEFLETSVAFGKHITLQYEYESDEGVVYGPPHTIPNCYRVNVPFRGFESALIIYFDGKFLERITPNEYGRYISALGKYSRFTFSADDFSTTVSTDGIFDSSPLVRQKNAVFMSKDLRPWEITANQMQMPNNEAVVGIESARLSEDEGIQSYEFYVMTDSSVYYVAGDAPVYALHPVTAQVGVATGYDGQALWTQTHYGSVFYGTDDRLYYISGRSIATIDDDVATPEMGSRIPLLYNTVYDLEYCSNIQELWVVTDTGIWAYQFGRVGIDGRVGFVANYDISSAVRAYYESNTGRVIIETSHGDLKYIDHVSSTYVDDPYIETQELLVDTQRTIIDRLECNITADSNNTPYITHAVIPPENSESGQVFSETVNINSLTPIYPKVSGMGHRLKIGGFDSLEEVALRLLGRPHN